METGRDLTIPDSEGESAIVSTLCICIHTYVTETVHAKAVITDLVKQLLKAREDLMMARYTIFGLQCDVKQRECEIYREREINAIALQYIPEEEQFHYKLELPVGQPMWMLPGHVVRCASPIFGMFKLLCLTNRLSFRLTPTATAVKMAMNYNR